MRVFQQLLCHHGRFRILYAVFLSKFRAQIVSSVVNDCKLIVVSLTCYCTDTGAVTINTIFEG